jgi:hypothetical protein
VQFQLSRLRVQQVLRGLSGGYDAGIA